LCLCLWEENEKFKIICSTNNIGELSTFTRHLVLLIGKKKIATNGTSTILFFCQLQQLTFVYDTC
jgi:hypothetical protein